MRIGPERTDWEQVFWRASVEFSFLACCKKKIERVASVAARDTAARRRDRA